MQSYHDHTPHEKRESACAADAQTLRARGYASDFVAAFLTMLEKSKPSMRDGLPFLSRMKRCECISR